MPSHDLGSRVDHIPVGPNGYIGIHVFTRLMVVSEEFPTYNPGHLCDVSPVPHLSEDAGQVSGVLGQGY